MWEQIRVPTDWHSSIDILYIGDFSAAFWRVVISDLLFSVIKHIFRSPSTLDTHQSCLIVESFSYEYWQSTRNRIGDTPIYFNIIYQIVANKFCLHNHRHFDIFDFRFQHRLNELIITLTLHQLHTSHLRIRRHIWRNWLNYFLIRVQWRNFDRTRLPKSNLKYLFSAYPNYKAYTIRMMLSNHNRSHVVIKLSAMAKRFVQLRHGSCVLVCWRIFIIRAFHSKYMKYLHNDASGSIRKTSKLSIETLRIT